MKKEIIRWNNTFPLDRWYRKKYNIPFSSKEHKEISQIDIYFEFLEDKIFLNKEKQDKLIEDKKKEYEEKGLWIKENNYVKEYMTEKQEEELLKNIEFNFDENSMLDISN